MSDSWLKRSPKDITSSRFTNKKTDQNHEACLVFSANAMKRYRGFDLSSEDSEGALQVTEIFSHESEDDRVRPTLLHGHFMAV